MPAWILVVGFAATMLGRVPIVVLPTPLGFQSLAGAVAFILAAALMLDRDVVTQGLRTTLSQTGAAAIVAGCVMKASGLHDPSLPLAMYAGIGLGAVGEELVFRGWFPTTLRRWFGNGRLRFEVTAVLVPALSFSLSHLLVQQHFSPARTGRVLVLLFVAAILYSELTRVGGLGLAVLVHTLLNVMALQFGIAAHRPAWYLIAASIAAVVVIGVARHVGSHQKWRLSGRAATTLYCAALAATLAVLTGNSGHVLLVAATAACWSVAQASLPKPAAWLPGLPPIPSRSPGTAPPPAHR
jgi:membrane protease YdiL (CAAX protease family)